MIIGQTIHLINGDIFSGKQPPFPKAWISFYHGTEMLDSMRRPYNCFISVSLSFWRLHCWWIWFFSKRVGQLNTLNMKALFVTNILKNSGDMTAADRLQNHFCFNLLFLTSQLLTISCNSKTINLFIKTILRNLICQLGNIRFLLKNICRNAACLSSLQTPCTSNFIVTSCFGHKNQFKEYCKWWNLPFEDAEF